MKILKIVNTWLLANAALGLLAWTLTNYLPERLTITADVDTPAQYHTEYGRGLTFTKGTSSSHLWMPICYCDKDVVLSRNASGGNLKFRSLILDQRLALRRYWSPRSVSIHDDGTVVLRRKDAKLDLPRLVKYGCLVELLILFLSAIALSLARMMPTSDGNENLLDCAVASFAVCAVCVLIVPMQTCLSNVSDFEFATSALFCDLLGPFFVSTVVVFVLLLWSTNVVKSLLIVIVSSFAVYAYLETGLMSVDFPELNGDISFFRQFNRAACDLAVWLVLFVVLFLGVRKAKHLTTFVSIGTLVLATASLFDIPKTQRIEPHVAFGKLIPIGEIAKAAFYSPKKNVLIYVLDQTSTPVVQDVIRNEPSFAKNMPGFVCYTNNIGMHGSTVLGVAGYMTGKYLDNPLEVGKYANSIFTESSFICDYEKDGFDVFFAPGSFDVGLTTCDVDGVNTSEVSSCSVIFRRITGQQAWNVYEVSRFKLLPFGLKFQFLILSFYGWDVSQLVTKESILYPMLATAPTKKDSKGTLQVWHTIGSHGAFDCDRFGPANVSSQFGYSPYFEQTWYVLSCVTNLLKELQVKGLYDNSFIVITADHGSRTVEPCVKISGNLQPLLMVKPVGSLGAIRYSNVPTSHSKIHDLVVNELKRNQNITNISNALRTEVRRFRSGAGGGGLSDALFDATMNQCKNVSLPKGVSFSATVIGLNHEYSLYCSNVDDVPPISAEGAGYHSATGPLMVMPNKGGKPAAKITFQVPSKRKDYFVSLEMRADPEVEFKVCGSKGTACMGKGGWKPLSMKTTATSDEDSKITIDIWANGNGWLQVRSLLVREK